jgi:hypothetical protein
MLPIVADIYFARKYLLVQNKNKIKSVQNNPVLRYTNNWLVPISWAKVSSKVKIIENLLLSAMKSKISQTRQSF